MRVQSAARRRPFSRAMQRGGMRGGRAGWHQPGCRVRYVRATPLASFSYSPCQTAHPPSLKLRRASKHARHSLGVGRQSFSFPRRVAVRGFFASSFASRPLRVLRPRAEGAAERRRRVTGMSVALARRNALPPVRREGASRRSRWRFSAAGPTLHLPAVPTGIRAATLPTARHSRPADRVPRLPRPRFAPPPRDATSPLRPRDISGDAPRERGWDHHYYILSS
jgi:hypothetical protein